MIRTHAVISTVSMGALALVLGWSSTVEAQQQQAGVAAAVRGRVEVAMTAGAVGREVKSGEAIYLGNAVKSGPDSGMQILLLDQTTFTIGPNSEITIDQFVFDPASGSGKVAASVAKGVFRFVTGKVAQTNPNDMTVRLPTGNIGIRGTIAVGSVEPGADGQPLKQEVVLLGPGSGRESAARVGSIVLTGGGSPVTLNQPGFGSQFGPGSGSASGWGTPIRYTPEMINALQSKLDTPISGKGPGAAAQDGQAGQQAGQQGASPLVLGHQGPPGPAGLAQLDQLNSIAFLGAQDQQTCQQSSVSSCTNLNPPPGMTIGAVANGNSTFEQLRSVASGTFFYAGSNVPLTDEGSYDILVNINFGNRTIGGGNSRVDVNGTSVGGSLAILTQSFASGSGTATFTQSGIAGLSGTLCSPSCSSSVSVTPQNSSGVIGATANHSITITGSGTVSGSGSATRQSGSAPPPG
ncbi:MAG: FecR domain-containing protein [Rhodospirillales bacterium]|nr:FecR domain-containing protein [Rhodospirillales bacterium]